MTLEYIKYVGPKEAGQISIRGLRPGNPYRDFVYKRGVRYYIGEEIPLSVAEWLTRYNGAYFKRVVDNDGDAYFKSELAKLIDKHMYRTGIGSFDIIRITSELLINEGLGDIEESDREEYVDLILQAYYEIFKINEEEDEGVERKETARNNGAKDKRGKKRAIVQADV